MFLFQAKALSVDEKINVVCDFIIEATSWAEGLKNVPIEQRLDNYTVKKTSTPHNAGTTEDDLMKTRSILHSIWFTVAGSFKNKAIFTLCKVCCTRTDSTKNNVGSTPNKYVYYCIYSALRCVNFLNACIYSALL